MVVAPSSFDRGMRKKEKNIEEERHVYIYLYIGTWMDGRMDRDVDTKEDGSERNAKSQVRRV